MRALGRGGHFRFLALAGLVSLVAWGGFRAVSVKLAQHVVLVPVGSLVPQGSKPGTLTGLVAVKADGGGGIIALTLQNGVYRVQHFDARLKLLAYALFNQKTTGVLVDLAVLPGGDVRLAGQNGILWSLDPGLRPDRRNFKASTGRLRLLSLDRLVDGRLVAIDSDQGCVVTLNSDGKVLRALPVPAAADVRDVAVVPQGLAWMEFDGPMVWVRVVTVDGRTLGRFRIRGVRSGPAVHLAASGRVLIVNDVGGSVGVVFYSVTGLPLGSALGAGSYMIVNPGFVAGDPAGGVAYIHFEYGLIKVELPFKDGA